MARNTIISLKLAASLHVLCSCAPHCWLSQTCIKYYQAALINCLPQGLVYNNYIIDRTILILTPGATQGKGRRGEQQLIGD